MSSRTILLIAASAALVAWTRGMPSPRHVDLDKALNRTVCPIVVEVDYHKDRVPRRIKIMRCAPEPNKWCKPKIHEHECCNHTHNDHTMECVEMYDDVLVQYTNSSTMTILSVAVGCSCMVVQSTRADTVPTEP